MIRIILEPSRAREKAEAILALGDVGCHIVDDLEVVDELLALTDGKDIQFERHDGWRVNGEMAKNIRNHLCVDIR